MNVNFEKRAAISKQSFNYAPSSRSYIILALVLGTVELPGHIDSVLKDDKIGVAQQVCFWLP